MTREEFDSKQWRKGMRCFIEVEIGDKKKKSYGTIMKVLFGAQAVGIKFDGKDYVERIGCERVTLQEDYDRQQLEQKTLSEKAKSITDQMLVCHGNIERLIKLHRCGIVRSVTSDSYEVTVDIDGRITVNHLQWLIRLKDGKVCRCHATYHERMECEGLISGDDFGFTEAPAGGNGSRQC